MALSIVAIIRLTLLSVVTTFSIIALGLAASSITADVTVIGFYFSSDALGVATAILGIITLPVLIMLGLLGKAAFLNYIVIESAWLSFLWVLWLATAADAAGSGGSMAVQAFAWLNWIFLMGYIALTVVLAIVQQTRGNSVWFKSVNEVDLFAPPAEKPMESGMMPPQQQQVPQQPVSQQMPPQQM
ncbi:hypothetical protein AX15_005802 [Amanita polypyramis BW_CC]|nr:hypothetical protein AX15_005802 [Amanita polypyramis BW_CC]